MRAFEIKAQSLAEALTDFGDQSGLQVSVNAADVRGRTSASVSGRMTPGQALSRLLAGTGLQFRIDGHIVSLSRASQQVTDGTVQLGPLRVEGDRGATRETGAERDARQADAVYDRDLSSTYAGKEEVERYKGVNTADIFKGMVNVFSGDARNGGAIDPSIRGIQGPGRVPVLIDGTEQALTVWRGYNGASNRSYVDPSLISGLQVLKGPVSVRGVNGSTGGAVVINTLDASDILQPGKSFGIEARVEGGNNSTDPRLPTLLTGQDYRNVPGFPTGFSATYPYGDPSLRVNLRTGNQNEFLSFGDRALRLAVAGRVKDFELFGAYAYRERGNYFSGGTEAGYYQMADGQLNSNTYVRKLGLNYTPGNEVPNTSSELESWLLKATWNIANDQALQIGFRDSKSKFGEIMPSRIMTAGGGNFGNVQWPLSQVHAQAWNAEYKYQPDSKWIDFKANLWLTHTVSDTYSSGGFPNTASVAEPIIINNAVVNSRNNRYGITASNQFKLTPRLDLLLDGSWQHEKLGTDDQYTPAASRGWRQLPRQGRREEYRITLKGEWRPVSFLKFNAGLTWSGYWANDDFLPQYMSLYQQENGRPLGQNVISSWQTEYKTTGFGATQYEAYLRNVVYKNFPTAIQNILIPGALATYAANPYQFTITNQGPVWNPNAEGDFQRSGNFCNNGSLASVANYVAGSCAIVPNLTYVPITEAKRKSAHGWAPSLSATAYVSGATRFYVRYAEAYRFPSMFESTIGFSASIDPTHDLKPEHIDSWEAAWIQDLRPLFRLGQGQSADLKLTYYHNTTHDVIERSPSLLFSNIDRQVIAGFEFQARYDNGRFFTDLSAAHMTVNKVCDEGVAAIIDPRFYRVPDCVKYGFVSGFLLTQATPEDMVNWTVGGRFFDRRLEVGSRLNWYGGYDNPQLAEWTAETACVSGCALNIPFTWGETVTIDAYAKFRLNERFSAELTGLNLNDRYYLDPLSRSLLPAPGRTVKLSLTGRF